MAKKFINKENLKLAIDTLNKNIQEELDHKADIDGSYPDLSVGTAGNLLGSKEIVNSSAYRTSANDEDIEYGTAEIQSIKGNAIAWNQLMDGSIEQSGENINGLKYSFKNGTLTVESDSIVSNTNIAMINIGSVIQNHKYLNYLVYSKDSKHNSLFNLLLYERVNGELTKSHLIENKSTIFTATNTCTLAYISNKYQNNDVINVTYKNIQLFDLTLIYGAGNEPTTAEQFEADYQRWFGKPLEYEEYDEGSIRSVKATGIKTLGFNLYSGGDFEGTSFEWNRKKTLWKNDVGYAGRIYIQYDYEQERVDVIPTIKVFYTDGTTSGTYYDILNKNVLKGHATLITEQNKVISYIDTNYNTNGNVKISNICINFSWSGKRDGEYEPYWEETKPIPIIDLMGKLNGEGESVTIFPDGLKRAGNVYDEIFIENGVTKAIKRVGSVDLGSLSYSHINPNEASARFSSSRIDAVKQISGNPNILTYKYPTTSYNKITSTDKTITLRTSGSDTQENAQIYIKDDSCNSPEELKQSLQGVLLYYELAEPIIYTIDNFSLPLAYRIDDFGTEQILMPEDSVAPIITTKYGINAVDAIRRLNKSYISSRSADNLVEKLGGTKTWNEEKGIYEFDINLESCSCEELNDKDIDNIFFNPYNIKPSKAEACDVVFANKETNKLTIAREYNTNIFPPDKYEPIGVVVIPANHGVLKDGTGTLNQCGIMSLVPMSYNTPEKGGDFRSIYYGGYGIDISGKIDGLDRYDSYNGNGLINYDQVVIVNKSEPTVPTGTESKSYMPVQISVGQIPTWHNSTSGAPSPYSDDDYKSGRLNPAYIATESPSSSANCLSDFKGIVNTKILTDLATAQSDWKTADNIINSYDSGYYPAACCCARFHTTGTKAFVDCSIEELKTGTGFWYMPSCGEFGYILPRLYDITDTIMNLKDLYDVDFLLINKTYNWTSSNSSSNQARYINLYDGNLYNIDKKELNNVIAFMRL